MAGGYWGSNYNSGRYWSANYWGLTGELPAGSIFGQVAGIAAVTGDLSGLAALSGTAAGFSMASADLTGFFATLSGTAQGVAIVSGTLSNGYVAEAPAPAPSTGSGGPSVRRRKKRKRTVEEELELARARGTLRRLDSLWSSTPDPDAITFLEDLPDWAQDDPPAEPPRLYGPAFVSPGPAFSGTVPETDSFEKITDASRVVVERLLAEAQAKAAEIAALKKAQEDADDEDDIELLLLLF